MFSTLPTTPTLNAATGMSSRTRRAWSTTQSASTACRFSTPAVSCTVIAVTTDKAWHPIAVSVSRSACTPAPPVGSAAAKASTIEGEGMAAKYRRSVQAARRSGYDATAHCNSSQPNDGKARIQNLDVPDLRLHLQRRGGSARGGDPGRDPLGRRTHELD